MSDRSRLRLVVLRVVVVSILLTLLGRLSYMQVAEGGSYQSAASQNRVRDIISTAARGQILDDRGVALVTNRIALVVSVNRSQLLSKKKGGAEELARLSRVVAMSVDDINRITTPCVYSLPSGKRVKAIVGCWKGSPYQPVPIKSYRSDDIVQVQRVLSIVERQELFPGITAEYEPVRDYPAKTLAAHVLGYVGQLTGDDIKQPKYAKLAPTTAIGRSGVEAVYDDQLRGQDGVQKLLVDKDGNTAGVASQTPAIAGQDLVLSIDAGVQRAAEAALQQGIATARQTPDTGGGRSGNFKATTGAAITVEADTGRVIAMASYPTYNPADFVPRIPAAKYTQLLNAPGHPLVSNAVQGTFAPGSTFKIVSTSAALKSGAYNLNSYIPCPSSFLRKKNFEGESFGSLSFNVALIRSCDTVYYQIAYNLWQRDGGTKIAKNPAEYMVKEAKVFGFGKKTGIDLPDERVGLILSRAGKVQLYKDHKKDYCAGAKNPAKSAYIRQIDQENCDHGDVYNGGDAMNFAIGQGDVLVTPLQLAMAYAAMVNGGTLYTPQLAKGFLSSDGTVRTTLPPKVAGHLDVPAEWRNYITNALTGVTKPPGTAQGTFQGFPFSTLDVGGKTGTAEVDQNRKAPTSWFASFAPAGKAKYVTIVMVTEAGTGGTTAAPIARKIWEALYGLDGAKPTLTNGQTPGSLPVVRLDGTIGPPGTPIPHRPAATTSPSQAAGSGTQSLGLPWAEEARRSRKSPG
ncbi:MAG: penicillin-binding protein 2 [Frankiales bacterium]|nr:penicillin-binding protein 2 [Frankiales bacterium]